ncbi:MAG: NUDIX hydrolase [Clostridiales bacterium]|nr:NUDIX hydrolase [Clostridiales bacterium]
MDLKENIVARETVFSGKIFSVEHMDITLGDGSTGIRQVVRNPGASAVVALNGDGEIALVRQYRIAIEQPLYEIPAGKLDHGEDPFLCAKRELQEETGLMANTWQKLTAMYASPGFCDEVLHIYLAQDLIEGEACPDEGEFLTLSWMPLTEANEKILKGEIRDAKTIIGVLMAKARISK